MKRNRSNILEISIIFIAKVMSTPTYLLFCACTQNEIAQTNNINTPHIHCKSPGNIYLFPAYCVSTQSEIAQTSTIPIHHTPLQISWKYLLTHYLTFT